MLKQRSVRNGSLNNSNIPIQPLEMNTRLFLFLLPALFSRMALAEAPATAPAPAAVTAVAKPAISTPARPVAAAELQKKAGSSLLKSRQPIPVESDPSLMLDIPDPKPKPLPKKIVVKPAPITTAAIVSPTEPRPQLAVMGGSLAKPNLRLDKVVDPNLSMPITTEVAVVLSGNKFFPSKIKLREGLPTKLFFTTVNKKPGALVIERLQIQRWIAKEHPPNASEADRARWESSHEINASHVTEVIIADPKIGKYMFHDALTGAAGEINVE
jgi:hypothetical protein